MQTAPKIFGGDVRTHLLAFYSSEEENAEKYMEGLREVAKEFKGQVSCAHAVSTSSDVGKLSIVQGTIDTNHYA